MRLKYYIWGTKNLVKDTFKVKNGKYLDLKLLL